MFFDECSKLLRRGRHSSNKTHGLPTNCTDSSSNFISKYTQYPISEYGIKRFSYLIVCEHHIFAHMPHRTPPDASRCALVMLPRCSPEASGYLPDAPRCFQAAPPGPPVSFPDVPRTPLRCFPAAPRYLPAGDWGRTENNYGLSAAGLVSDPKQLWTLRDRSGVGPKTIMDSPKQVGGRTQNNYGLSKTGRGSDPKQFAPFGFGGYPWGHPRGPKIKWKNTT